MNHKPLILRRPVCDIEVTLAMCKYIVHHHQHHNMVMRLMYVGLTWWSDDLMIWPDILGPAPRSRSHSRAFQNLWSPPGGPCDMPAKIFCDMPAMKFCDMPAKICDNITLWYASQDIYVICLQSHIFSSLWLWYVGRGEIGGGIFRTSPGISLGLSNSSLGAHKREIPSNEHEAWAAFRWNGGIITRGRNSPLVM